MVMEKKKISWIKTYSCQWWAAYLIWLSHLKRRYKKKKKKHKYIHMRLSSKFRIIIKLKIWIIKCNFFSQKYHFKLYNSSSFGWKCLHRQFRHMSQTFPSLQQNNNRSLVCDYELLTFLVSLKCYTCNCAAHTVHTADSCTHSCSYIKTDTR